MSKDSHLPQKLRQRDGRTRCIIDQRTQVTHGIRLGRDADKIRGGAASEISAHPLRASPALCRIRFCGVQALAPGGRRFAP